MSLAKTLYRTAAVLALGLSAGACGKYAEPKTNPTLGIEPTATPILRIEPTPNPAQITYSPQLTRITTKNVRSSIMNAFTAIYIF